jgi:RimK family alpha-L-glutamate ligase
LKCDDCFTLILHPYSACLRVVHLQQFMVKCGGGGIQVEQAWLITNAFLRAPSFQRMEEALLLAAKRADIRLTLKANDAFVKSGSLDKHPDAALFFDKDVRLAQRMEASGMRLFNSAHAIGVCDDKTATSILIENAGLPQPRTIICPMTFPGVGYGDMGFLDGIAQEIGFPLVMKEGNGSFGKQVYLLQNMEQMRDKLKSIGHKPLLFQQYIKESSGQDLRVYAVGGHAVAAIHRVNRGDFRANLELGGTATARTPTREEKNLAIAACAACGANFAGVDLLLSRDGPLVCEVNSNAHFNGLTAVTGINPADSIMELLKAAI